MAEKKRSTTTRKTNTKRTSQSQRNRKKTEISPFFKGLGNEITGIVLIGLGLLLMAGIFTEKIGRIGDLLKTFAQASLGSLGYLLPVALLALGIAFILRKRDFLWNKRSLGSLILIIGILVFLSVRHIQLGDKIGFFPLVAGISDLAKGSHGGGLGILFTYPLVRLFGEVGAYILACLTVIVGGLLLFDTTLYDSLKKGKDLGENVHNKLSESRRQRQDLVQQAAGEEGVKGKAGLAPKKDEATKASLSAQTEKTETKEKADKELSFTFRSFLDKDVSKVTKKPEAAEPDGLSLPAFLQNKAKPAPMVETQKTASRFNIQVRPPEDRPQAEGASNPVTVPYLEGWNKLKEDRKASGVTQAPQCPLEEEGPAKEGQLDEHLEAARRLKEYQEYRKKHLAQTEPPKADKGRQLEMPEADRIEEAEVKEKPEKKKPDYHYPGVSLLKENMRGMLDENDQQEIMENAKKLQETLGTFGVEARVIDVSKGPSVTRYELQLKAGIKVSKVTNLADDIALSLAASGVRIEAPIPGKAAVGIEIPNKETTPVFLREVIDSDKFRNTRQKLAMGLGKDISGDIIVGDITRYPHVLIAGATGSGKSVCINSLIISLLYKYSPEEVRLIMVDPKMVELSMYNGIPHLLIPVVTDPKKAAGALNWAVNEMTRRYDLFNNNSCRNIEGYNELADKGKVGEKLPYIVIIVDELADLMMVAAGEVESYIARLAQMARAAGMHLVIATQRPSVDVITGMIKANIPSRISFAVSSYVDSKTILDQGGAEKLLGKGDMLYSPMGARKPRRVQGAFISEDEVEAIVDSVKVVESEVHYDESIIEHIEKGAAGGAEGEEVDELFDEAVQVVIENNQASTSFLQRKMRIGYNRAARIIDDLEARGVISGPDGSKPRKVIWTGDDSLT